MEIEKPFSKSIMDDISSNAKKYDNIATEDYFIGMEVETKEDLFFTEEDYHMVDLVDDWYLFENNIDKSFVFPGPVYVQERPVLMKYAELIYNEVLKAVEEKKKKNKDDFREIFLRIRLPNIQGTLIFRGNKIKTIGGTFWALRRAKGVVPDLANLGMPKNLVEVLTNPNLKSGLVLIVGETGNGKSTTCASIIKELCRTRGSFALTIEDPPELPLHGVQGKGVCLQTEVSKGDFGEAIRSAMRSYPAVNNSILYVGEVRDSETARELIRVSANGHLVFTTIHGADIISGIKRLVDSAVDNSDGKSNDIRSMLASSLRLVVHQELKSLPFSMNQDVEKPEKVLFVDFVLADGASSALGNLLHHNKLDGLQNVIERQKRMLESRGIKALIQEEFSFKG